MKQISNLSLNAILLAILFASCGNKETPIHPTFEKISSSVYASGIVKSRHQYDVYSKTNGLLTEILVKEGELVTKGQAILNWRIKHKH
jgi:multidrug efflux pump subunit AcrA (membrane-fusion protein)